MFVNFSDRYISLKKICWENNRQLKNPDKFDKANDGERKYFYNSHCVDCGGKIDYASVYHFNTKK